MHPPSSDMDVAVASPSPPVPEPEPETCAWGVHCMLIEAQAGLQEDLRVFGKLLSWLRAEARRTRDDTGSDPEQRARSTANAIRRLRALRERIVQRNMTTDGLLARVVGIVRRRQRRGRGAPPPLWLLLADRTVRRDLRQRISSSDATMSLPDELSNDDGAPMSVALRALGRIGDAAHDLARMAAFCARYRWRLDAVAPDFELRVRVRQVMEVARTGSPLEAIAHARRYVSPLVLDPERRQSAVYASAAATAVRKAMLLVAYAASGNLDASAAPLRHLLEPAWRTKLAGDFVEVACQCLRLPQAPLLETLIRVGLSTCKTAYCGLHKPDAPDPSGTGYRECTACYGPLAELAKGLPNMHVEHSMVWCRLTKRRMDSDADPPVVIRIALRMSDDQQPVDQVNAVVSREGALKCLSRDAREDMDSVLATRVYIV